MNCGPIFDYVNLSPRYGLIVSREGCVLLCNPVLLQALGDVHAESYKDVFITGAEYVCELAEKAISQQSMVREELHVDFGNGILPVFVEFSPLVVNGADIVVVLFHPIQALLDLESALFDRRSKTLADSRWVVCEEGRILHFRSEPTSIFHGKDPGYCFFDAVPPAACEAVHNAFDKARSSGRVETVRFEAFKVHGLAEVEADIGFAEDAFYGNRFFILTRLVTNRPAEILDRMAEAYQVGKDLELAAMLNVNPVQISKARNGRDVPAKWILKCCSEKMIRLPWLMSGAGEKFEDTAF